MTGGAIRNCVLSANNGANGGVYIYSGASFTMEGGVIAGCSAMSGGGILASMCTVRITGGRIENCKASERGGGLSVRGHTNGPVSVLDAAISGCEAENGGGVALMGFAELELGENARITGCKATNGAAVYMDLESTYTVNHPGCFLYANGGRVEGTVYVGTNKIGTKNNYLDSVKATDAIDHTDGKPTTVFTGDVSCEGDIRGGIFHGSVTVTDSNGNMGTAWEKFCGNLSGGSFYKPVRTECHVSGGTYYDGLTLEKNAKLSGQPMNTGTVINDKTNIPNPTGTPVTVTYAYGALGGTYVTPILFFKRLSDVYDEETQVALEESGGDEEYASFAENHRFVIPDGCHWQDVREASENVGVAIVNAMNGIERANPDTLSGVFSSFDDANWTDKTKLSDERLKDLIEHMSKLKVGNNNYSADVMGDSYEFLIKKFADLSKKNAGEFYTPRSIVKLLIMLLAPKAGETVYDPACGTGGMLIEAIRFMHGDKLTYGRIYGQEKNLATSAIARMNLFLHGAKDFKVTQGDTLRAPNYLERGSLQTFDCVVANPPFSLKNWGSEQFSSDIYGRNIWGCPTDSNGDFAWLQHMVKSMNPKTGRCAVVLPQGVLFRSGKEGGIRKQLVESDKLEAIITMASGVFYSTGVSACILFLNNNKAVSHRGRICMIDGSGIYTPQRAQNIMTEADIQTVFDYYTAYEDVVEKVKIVTIADIREKDYSLAINNYIEKKEQETVPPEEIRRQYFEAYDEMIKAETRMRELLLKGGYVSE